MSDRLSVALDVARDTSLSLGEKTLQWAESSNAPLLHREELNKQNDFLDFV